LLTGELSDNNEDDNELSDNNDDNELSDTNKDDNELFKNNNELIDEQQSTKNNSCHTCVVCILLHITYMIVICYISMFAEIRFTFSVL